ncbi:hypothetical protein T08_10632 [Trichinella sp. T8]|nr:hypothetical protein T08_10632 [Trichinella sp. T8]
MDAVFDIVADDGNTSSRHSKLSYIASGQPINFVHHSYELRHLMVSVLVPSGVSSPGNKGIHKLLFGLAYHNVARHHGAVITGICERFMD